MIAVTLNDGLDIALVVTLGLIAVLIIVALVVAIKTMDSLRRNIEELRQGPAPSGDQYVVFHQGASLANGQFTYPPGLYPSNPQALERVNDPLWSERPMTAGIEAASRLAYLAFSNPVIKTLALGSGTMRAVRSFRRN